MALLGILQSTYLWRAPAPTATARSSPQSAESDGYCAVIKTRDPSVEHCLLSRSHLVAAERRERRLLDRRELLGGRAGPQPELAVAVRAPHDDRALLRQADAVRRADGQLHMT